MLYQDDACKAFTDSGDGRGGLGHVIDPAMAEVKLGQPVSRRLGDLLVAEGLVKEEQLRRPCPSRRARPTSSDRSSFA